MAEDPRVVVLGGGIVGLCCAYYLAKAGRQVTVLDKGEIGAGCSAGNAGWICPSEALPVPAPGVVRFTIASLGRPDSPVYLRPAPDIGFLGWLWRFWRSCSPRRFEQGRAALVELARPTFELFDGLRRDGVAFEEHRTGLLHAFLDHDAARRALAESDFIREMGYRVPHRVERGREVQEREPALLPGVQACYLIEGERHVDPTSLTSQLAARLRAMGVGLEAGVEATGLVRGGHRLEGVRTSEGVLAAAVVVVALGAWSRRFLAREGVDIPVRAGKGYSVGVACPTTPSHALHLVDRRVACSPFADYVRVAGTMEITGENQRLDQRRVSAMLAGARQYIDLTTAGAVGPGRDPWVGMRPLSADGLPVIDRVGDDGLFVTTGHGMLGVTLGPSTGRALADYVLSGSRPAVLQGLSMGRFGRR